GSSGACRGYFPGGPRLEETRSKGGQPRWRARRFRSPRRRGTTLVSSPRPSLTLPRARKRIREGRVRRAWGRAHRAQTARICDRHEQREGGDQGRDETGGVDRQRDRLGQPGDFGGAEVLPRG